MNKFVRTKSHTGSKFSKTSLGLLCKWWIVVLQFFYVASDGATANHHISDSIFWSFFTSLSKDSITYYAWIHTLFLPTIRGLDMHYNTLNISQIDRWPHKIHKFVVAVFQNAKKSAAGLCQILRMVTIEIVINSNCVTISCRFCIAFEVMLLFLVDYIISS